MNVVILMGNLARDPEMRYTPTGQGICDASVCVSKKWRTESGEEKERKAFISLTIWGDSGQRFSEHHRKGDRVLVHGELAQDTWVDKATGKNQQKTRVQVERWEFVKGARSGQEDARRQTAPKAAPKTETEAAPAPEDSAEDDVPF